MGERLYLPVDFPSADILKESTLKAIETNEGVVTPDQIKEFVAKDLKLSDEVLEFENSDGLTLLIDYRLRWARTALKNEGKIINVSRGKWCLSKND